MSKFLLFLHQLPQNILALVVYLFVNPKRYCSNIDGQWVTYHVAQRFQGGWGVSLGDFIFFGYKPPEKSIRHEHGHQFQSLYLGWLYLLAVGLPSFLGCIYDVWFHSKWTSDERIRWYYSRYPENCADKLGNVERFV